MGEIKKYFSLDSHFQFWKLKSPFRNHCSELVRFPPPRFFIFKKNPNLHVASLIKWQKDERKKRKFSALVAKGKSQFSRKISRVLTILGARTSLSFSRNCPGFDKIIDNCSTDVDTVAPFVDHAWERTWQTRERRGQNVADSETGWHPLMNDVTTSVRSDPGAFVRDTRPRRTIRRTQSTFAIGLKAELTGRTLFSPRKAVVKPSRPIDALWKRYEFPKTEAYRFFFPSLCYAQRTRKSLARKQAFRFFFLFFFSRGHLVRHWHGFCFSCEDTRSFMYDVTYNVRYLRKKNSRLSFTL